MTQHNNIPYKYFYESDSDEDVMPRAFPIDDDQAEPQDLSSLPDTAEAYLKQVRWERKQVPKVVVANVNPRAYDAEQTMYLAQSSFSVAKAPPGMSPTPEWEEMFLKGFTRLHEDLEYSYAAHSASNSSSIECPPINDPIKWSQYCFGKKKKMEQKHLTQTQQTPSEPKEATLEGNLDNPSEDGEIKEEEQESSEEAESLSTVLPVAQDTMELIDDQHATEPLAEKPSSEEFEKLPHSPTMQLLFALDSVGIQAVLKHHIAWMEKEKLTELRSAWLFALMSRLEKPLLDDTASNLRKLLRRLCFIRFRLTDPKDPVLPNLNILITIITKFFGQKE